MQQRVYNLNDKIFMFENCFLNNKSCFVTRDIKCYEIGDVIEFDSKEKLLKKINIFNIF